MAFSYSVTHTHTKLITGSNSGTMAKALISHKCDLLLNPGVNATCALGLLWVLSL